MSDELGHLLAWLGVARGQVRYDVFYLSAPYYSGMLSATLFRGLARWIKRHFQPPTVRGCSLQHLVYAAHLAPF